MNFIHFNHQDNALTTTEPIVLWETFSDITANQFLLMDTKLPYLIFSIGTIHQSNLDVKLSSSKQVEFTV